MQDDSRPRGRVYKDPGTRSKLDDCQRRLTGEPPPTPPTLSELIQEALQTLAAAGIELDHLDLSNGHKWKRPRGKDHLWYVTDTGTGASGTPWLMVTAGNLKETGDPHLSSAIYKSWETDRHQVSQAERDAIQRQLRENEQARKEAGQERRAAAREAAQLMWDAATTEVNGHPYLVTKGVSAHGIRRNADTLLIPFADADGILCGLQRIEPNGAKRFTAGAGVKGNYFPIGDLDQPGPLYLCEGYATGASIHEITGQPVVVAFNCGNLEPAAKVLRDAHPERELVICGDDDRRTEGNPGRTHAEKAAAAVGGSVVFPIFSDPTNSGTDFNDLMREEGKDALLALLREPQPVEESLEAAVGRLAKLKPLEYDRVRAEEAERLGVRAATLDKEVSRVRGAEQEDALQGQKVELYEPEPWPEPVEGHVVLDAALAAVMGHMVMNRLDAVAAVLWAAHAHVFKAFSHTPRLLVTAPEHGCGKTVLLFDVVGDLVTRPERTEILRAAPFFRMTAGLTPTWLIDEADQILVEESGDLIAALNGGFDPHGGVVRCVGDGFETRRFPTHTPVGMAGIGLLDKLPIALLSRCVVINLDRATEEERLGIATFDKRFHHPPLLELGRKLARWTQDHLEEIRTADPVMPRGVINRMADVWRPLLILADLAGGEWPRLARAALSGQTDDKEPSKALRLLMDIKDVVRPGEKSIATVVLIERLCSLEDGPWSGHNFRARDEAERRIKPEQVAKLLGTYRVKSQAVRPDVLPPNNKPVAKGYVVSDLEKAWKRYLRPLAPQEGVTGLQIKKINELRGYSPAPDSSGLLPHKSLNNKGCNRVTPPRGETPEESTSEPPSQGVTRQPGRRRL